MRRQFSELGILTGMIFIIASILLTGCNGQPSGAELYTLNCAGCHGAAGRGGLASALSNSAYLTTHDDATIQRITRAGIPNTTMRAFGKANGGALTDEQITAVINYLRSQ